MLVVRSLLTLRVSCPWIVVDWSFLIVTVSLPSTVSVRSALTSVVSSFLTRDWKSFSAWMYRSSLPFLSSKRISLKLEAEPSLELRLLMPLCVELAGRSYGGI